MHVLPSGAKAEPRKALGGKLADVRDAEDGAGPQQLKTWRKGGLQQLKSKYERLARQTRSPKLQASARQTLKDIFYF